MQHDSPGTIWYPKGAVRLLLASVCCVVLLLFAIPSVCAVDAEPPVQGRNVTGPGTPAAVPPIAADRSPVPVGGPGPEILLFIVPDYPAASKARNESGAVDVVAHLDMDGVIIRYVIESPPSDFDDPVRQVLGKWIIVPPSCSDQWVDKYELRFSVVFSAEEGHFYVSVKGAKFLDTAPPPATGRPSFTTAAGNLVKPVYPRKAILDNVYRGLAQANVHVDKDGKVIDVEVPFTYPRDYFVRVTKDAVSQWTLPPDPDGKSWYGCVQVRFTLQ